MIIREYREGAVTEKTDWLAEERMIRLRTNGGLDVRISMSPGDLRPFACGYMATSGWVRSVAEIRDIAVDGDTVTVSFFNPPPHEDRPRGVVPIGCGGNPPEVIQEKKERRENKLPPLETLAEVFREFHRISDLFEDTGGVHSAALTDGREIIHFSEDIGRHNAVDKTVGKALLAGDGVAERFLLISGRVAGEIIRKMAYVGIRGVISPSAPTSAAVLAARDLNMGLIGFLRGRRFNIY